MKAILVFLILIFLSLKNFGQSSWTKTALTDKFQIECLASINGDLYAGLGGGGMFKSSDEGTTWAEINNGLGKKYITSITGKGNKIYVSSYAEGIFISDNKGQSWSLMETAPGSKYIFSLVTSGANLLAATWDGIYFSSDEKKWNKAVLNGVRKHNIILGLFESKKSLIAGSGRYVFTSKDNGKTWESANSGSLYDILSFAEQDNILFLGTSGDGLYQSPDNGKNWIKKLNNKSESELQNVPSIIVDSLSVLAGSPTSGVINEGIKMNQGLAGLNIKSLIKHKGYYFAGTPAVGLWKYAVKTKLQNLEERSAFELISSIYPNPAVANSTLNYSINEKTNVNIDLMQTDGKLIKHVQFLSQEPGEYQLKLNGFLLNSGIYFLRIKARDIVQLKKLCIVY